MRLFVFLFILLQTLTGCGQQPEWKYIPAVTTQHVLLGDANLVLQVYRYNDTLTPFFVHLHHNEQTADSVLHHYLQRNGGSALNLRNGLQRIISFSASGLRYHVDPNRMFTPKGREQSMKLLGPYRKEVADSIRRFAQSFLALLPDSIPLIAMHNNTDGAYSLLSYLPGGVFAEETKNSHHNPDMDPDDFVLTTDSLLFVALQAANINVVLQNNDQVADDGSLGYYFGKQGRTYVNIEAEHGYFDRQMNLLKAVVHSLYLKP